ncbi:mycothiol transferase [Actinacidiphila sp. bgisy160]|uniref:mycothiol transferase n=1 Tax=Actinacidiphila sp. bgisy160 TaxID=3413796 RepID=UPI003D755DF4
MKSADLLADAFGRIQETVHEAVEGMSLDALHARPDKGANSIAWLIWHLTRVQDDHVAGVAGTGQLWTDGGWADRFGLPFAPYDTGYGHRPKDVAALRVESGELLTGYHDAVYEHTLGYLRTLRETDFPRVVDTSWDPPVTLAVRLVSVVSDDLQHAGQAAFLRGCVERGAL